MFIAATKNTLVIDIGNSFIKWQIIDQNFTLNQIKNNNITNLKEIFTQIYCINHQQSNFLELFLHQINKHFPNLKLKLAAISSVQKAHEVMQKISHLLNHHINLWNNQPNIFIAKTQSSIHLTDKTLINGYENTEQLGIDRWLAMITAALSQSKNNSKWAVVDFGSVISVDFCHSQNKKIIHLGGLLLPNYELFEKSLAHKMPLIKLYHSTNTDYDDLGKNTISCIELGFFASLKNLFNHHSKFKQCDKIYLTGGSLENDDFAPFFAQLKLIKSKQFISLNFLVLLGLFYQAINSK